MPCCPCWLLSSMAASSAPLVTSKARCMYQSEFSCIKIYFFNLGCLKQWVKQNHDPQRFCESECYATHDLRNFHSFFFGRGVPKYDWETPSPQSSWPIHQRGTVVVPIRKFGLCFSFDSSLRLYKDSVMSDLELWDQLNPKETGSIRESQEVTLQTKACETLQPSNRNQSRLKRQNRLPVKLVRLFSKEDQHFKAMSQTHGVHSNAPLHTLLPWT